MLVFYNLLQLILLPLLSPLLIVVILATAKYRQQVLSRLGFDLHRHLPDRAHRQGPLFWIHTLSVGETTSALPLIKEIRKTQPNAILILSVTTHSGRRLAKKVSSGIVDCVISSPLDILPVVHYFLKRIQPDCFLLVETDFWPNILHLLKKKGIPAILINGRISDASLRGYRKMSFFFQPMFQNLDALCLQSKEDRDKLLSLGIPQEKLHILGNLKFDTQPAQNKTLLNELTLQLPKNRLRLIAGSIHAGEETHLLQAFLTLQKDFPSLYLIIAPRNLDRVPAIEKQCAQKGLKTQLRTKQQGAGNGTSEIFLLNTLGELATCYQLAEIAFVGGSLVEKRGHNPIEPALFAHPVLFGPHMEDFNAIAAELVKAGGAFVVHDTESLITTLRSLLQSKTEREQAGKAAQQSVLQQQGGIVRHLQLINSFLE